MRPRVVHVLENLSVLHGGSTTAAFAITEATKHKCNVQCIGPTAPGLPQVNYITALASGKWVFPWRALMWLYNHRTSIDIVEIHNVFGPSSLLSLLYCSLVGQPYVLNPHNSLDSMDLMKKYRLKQVVGYGFLSWVLTIGGHVRCATRREYERLVCFGGSWSAYWALLPIPVKNHAIMRGRSRIEELEGGSELKLLFMSRIDRKKRLEVLIDAIDKSRQVLRPFKLIIAGAGDGAYENELKNKITNLGLADYVEWRGFVRGEVKAKLLCEADVFILPSAYENFGIVVLEALASGLRPVVSNMVFIADHLDANQCVVVTDDWQYSRLLASARYNPADYWSDSKAADSLSGMLRGEFGASRIVNYYSGMLKNMGVGRPII